MTNDEVAKLLRDIAAVYNVQQESRFRIAAYERAADVIEKMGAEVEELWREGNLSAVPGLGASLQEHLDELFKTGHVKKYDNLMKKMPEGMFKLLEVPGIGPKTAYRLSKELGIHSVETLEKAALNGLVRDLEGFGVVSERDLLRGVKEFKGRTGRILLAKAYPAAVSYMEYLEKSSFVKRVDTLGSLRRMMPTVGDIDLSVVSNKPSEVVSYFTAYPLVERVLEQGEAKAAVILKNGIQVDLRVQDESSYGSLLQHFTGSKHHNIRLREYAIHNGMSLSEYGIKKQGKIHKFLTEEEFYKYLGMNYIEPELREDRGEIEASIAGKLPKLVEYEDVKGDFHVHSDFDTETSHDLGVSSMKELIKKAESLNYEYLGFSEHNPSIGGHTKEQIKDILKRKIEAIEEINSLSKKVRVYNLLEVDIMSDSSLAIDESVFDFLDFFIVSIHSGFSQPKEVITKRMISALSYPKAKILAHPTGRLLGSREEYQVDWDELFDFCVKHKKFIEINGSPQRMDLPETLVREAINYGVKFVIGTDSHGVGQMDFMRYGISVARRGWCEKNNIVNTLPVEKLNDILKSEL